LAVKLEIREKIIFVGLKNNIYPYLALLDIGVLTSESEGFPNAILEYMAAGLPVVCPESGGNSELIKDGENGFLVKVDNQEETAGRILDLLQNNLLCMQMKTANKKKILSYTWLRNITVLDDYYNKLMGLSTKLRTL